MIAQVIQLSKVMELKRREEEAEKEKRWRQWAKWYEGTIPKTIMSATEGEGR